MCVCVFTSFHFFYKMHNQPNINEAFLFNPVEIYLQSLACNQPTIIPQPGFKINKICFKKTLEKIIKNEVGYNKRVY